MDLCPQQYLQSTSRISTLGRASEKCPYSRSLIIPEVSLYVLQLDGTLLWAWTILSFIHVLSLYPQSLLAKLTVLPCILKTVPVILSLACFPATEPPFDLYAARTCWCSAGCAVTGNAGISTDYGEFNCHCLLVRANTCHALCATDASSLG